MIELKIPENCPLQITVTKPPTDAEKAAGDAPIKEIVPWTFAKCVQHIVNTCGRFNLAGAGIRAGGRIIDAVSGKEAGDIAIFKIDEDVKELSDALEKPDAGFCPPLEQTPPSRLFLNYMDAVYAAKK